MREREDVLWRERHGRGVEQAPGRGWLVAPTPPGICLVEVRHGEVLADYYLAAGLPLPSLTLRNRRRAGRAGSGR